MTSQRSLELVVFGTFLFALALPALLGTRVPPPRSPLDILIGFSRFNLALSKVLAAPVIGLGVIYTLLLDPAVPYWAVLVAIIGIAGLVLGAFVVGSRRKMQTVAPVKADSELDGKSYEERFKSLEDGILDS